MNEELQIVLTEILNGVLTAKDFMLAELPEVVQQLLLWKFCFHLISFIVGFIIAVVSVCVTKKIYKWLKKDSYAGEEAFTALILLPIGFGVAIMASNITWLQIWLAPKVYLIEYAASLAK